MSLHKLTAGSGYDYLTRQVAALDATEKGHTGLASYYTERGESPGVWIGSGMDGIDGLAAGDPVTAEQMRALFGCGLHPLAELRQQQLEGPDLTLRDFQDAARLGAPFRLVDGDVSPFRLEVARRIAVINSAAGLPVDAPLPAADRARVRTAVAREFFLRRPRAPERDGMAGGVSSNSGQLHPDVGSWLNLVDVWFPIIERQAIHRGSFPSVRDLMIKIREFINGWHNRCHPFLGTKPADEVIDKIKRKKLANVPLGVTGRLVGEVGEVVNRAGADQAQGFLVAGLAEEPLACPEDDRVDHQPQLVDEVVLDQRVQELEAGGDDDVPGYLLLQFRDRVHDVALEDRRVIPLGILESGGHDVLGLDVQPVCEGASP
jgi:TrwC relaxase